MHAKSAFQGLQSVGRLKELAKEPFDLAQEKNLTPKRLEAMVAEAAGFKLFYGTERVDEGVLEALYRLAEESSAVKKMEAVQSGEIVNQIYGFESEERPALHTAMRDFFEQRNPSKKAQEATQLAYRELEKLKAFLKEIDSKRTITDLVQIGIGGSELGPKAIYIALRAYQKQHRRVHFLSNVDPDDGAHIFKQLDLSKTLILVVSKSGTTLETLTNEAFVKELLKKEGLNPKDHLVAITGEGSPMDDPSHYLASFYIWDYIGGRYSVTSMVGAVCLAFALGMDRLLDFLRGASVMDKVALRPNPKENLPLLSALLGIWNRNFLRLPTCAVIPYAQALSRFPAHLQQLDMESNGKRIDKNGASVDFDTGPIIWGEPGTNGQHSFFQSLHQGTTIVPMEIIGFRESQYHEDIVYSGTTCQEKLLANLLAQSIALATGEKNANPNKYFPGNRPNRILFGQRLDPYTMGALLAYYEHKVVFQALIWNTNPFDQEGVQLGKRLALKIIDQFDLLRQGKALDSKDFPLSQALLSHLSTNLTQ
jgi:glucose-6-phosphate isomerase